MVEKKGGRFILDSLDYIDPVSKTIFLINKNPIDYDVLSFNTGSIIKDISVDNTSNIFKVKPISNIVSLRRKIIELSEPRNITVSVIGGGPAGVEISANIRALQKSYCKNDIAINLFCGSGILSGFDEKFRSAAKKHMVDKRIIIIPGFAESIENNTVVTKERSFVSDIVVLSSGVEPPRMFKKSGLPTGPDGGLMVNKYLQSAGYPEIFGGGDCIYFKESPLSKIGVHAVKQNKIILNNLSMFIENQELSPFAPGGDYLQILNLGDHMGLLKKKGFIYSGKPAFWLKNAIDRKFMNKYG